MPPPEDLTIDELARASGMTVRNIRAHQARGLLPAPEIRARTGFYDQRHVERLRAIQDLQAEGYNLKAIERVLSSGGEGELTFGRAARDAFLDEEPELTTGAELAQRLGGALDPKALAKAIKLDVIRPLGDDRFEVPSPTLLRAGEELVALGIPLAHALAVAQTIQKQTRPIAAAFVRLFVEDVLCADGTDDTADWTQHEDALERLRPLAAEAVRASFQQAMRREVEREVERRLRR